jgi:hypothetical protein
VPVPACVATGRATMWPCFASRLARCCLRRRRGEERAGTHPTGFCITPPALLAVRTRSSAAGLRLQAQPREQHTLPPWQG